MKQKIVVTFDIADQSFKIFNMQQWESYIAELRDQLADDYLYEDDEEVIEIVHGDELFWEVVEVENI
jgi:hypothetical protein